MALPSGDPVLEAGIAPTYSVQPTSASGITARQLGQLEAIASSGPQQQQQQNRDLKLPEAAALSAGWSLVKPEATAQQTPSAPSQEPVVSARRDMPVPTSGQEVQR